LADKSPKVKPLYLQFDIREYRLPTCDLGQARRKSPI
jgi:hypothetical protein